MDLRLTSLSLSILPRSDSSMNEEVVEAMTARVRSYRLRMAPRSAVLIAAVLASLAFAASSVAAIDDVRGGTHTYGGFTCSYGGGSHLDATGGSPGNSITIIQTPACLNGYRELFTSAVKTNRFTVVHYSGWKLYNYLWSFPGAGPLCEVFGNHRMSKAGPDTSPYVYTYVTGSCHA